MVDENAKHYLVRVTGMPPTELECKCGSRAEGGGCIERMATHIKEGNRE
jgi:hypothetical protein